MQKQRKEKKEKERARGMKIERQTSTEQQSIKAEYNVEQEVCKNSFLKESVSQTHSGL